MNFWPIAGTLITLFTTFIAFIFKKIFKDIHAAHDYIKFLKKEIERHERNETFLMNKILTIKQQAELHSWEFKDIDWNLEKREG